MTEQLSWVRWRTMGMVPTLSTSPLRLLHGPHPLNITVDGHHVQGSPYHLEVKSNYTSLCDFQQVINVKYPSCVAIHENGDIYVGSAVHRIYVFDQGGHLKNIIGSYGSGDGQFYGPCSISIIGVVMYIADFNNHRIQKLTTGENSFISLVHLDYVRDSCGVHVVLLTQRTG